MKKIFMRIGIVTFWQGKDNYGQILQCWALQRYLISCGHEPFLIRYNLGNNRLLGTLIKRLFKLFSIIPLIFQRGYWERRKLYKLNLVKNKLRNFDAFREKYIITSDCVYLNLKQLQQDSPLADIYIVGSDQVWNPSLLSSKENNAFWLDFGDKNIKRISYAASFGTDTCPKELKKKLCNQLKRFDEISVREESGINICRECGRKATHVLDPTLLLSMDDYISLIENKSKKSESYIFIYSINIEDKNEIEYNELREFSNNKHFSTIVTPASGYIPSQELFDDVEYSYATISEWLSLIKESEFVVTTSFHGVVFCILMHKSFIYFPLKGKFSKGNNRVIDLLEKLKLADHIWREKGDYNKIYSINTDWKLVENLLSTLRKSSYDFLNKSLM